MDRPVDRLTDEEVAVVNAAHRWDSSTNDAHGRKIGCPGGRHYDIPHRFVISAEQWLGVKGRSIVEFGCLEGAQTIALCELSPRVTAVDVRPENLVKTAVRTALYGHFPRILAVDVEVTMPPEADVYFHSGVLYHLQDPVHHLHQIGQRCDGLLLDTHHTLNPRGTYTAKNGAVHRCEDHPEQVRAIRAGIRPVSRWLALSTIKGVLGKYFSDVAVLSDRMEMNGPRCTIIAKGGKRAR